MLLLRNIISTSKQYPNTLLRQFAKKKQRRAKKLVIPDPEFDPLFALKMIRMHSFSFSDPSIDLILH